MTHSGVMGTCFGPPPLPPKRSSGDARRQSLNRRNRSLTSTYRSFRDPSEEDEIIVVASEDLEVASLTGRTYSKQHSCSSVTSSLSRKSNASSSMIPLSLVSRSHSDGNLTNCTRRRATTSSGSGNFGAASGTLNRCLRVLGSSWKNLLQCEFCVLNRRIILVKYRVRSAILCSVIESSWGFMAVMVVVVVQVMAVVWDYTV